MAGEIQLFQNTCTKIDLNIQYNKNGKSCELYLQGSAVVQYFGEANQQGIFLVKFVDAYRIKILPCPLYDLCLLNPHKCVGVIQFWKLSAAATLMIKQYYIQLVVGSWVTQMNITIIHIKYPHNVHLTIVYLCVWYFSV